MPTKDELMKQLEEIDNEDNGDTPKRKRKTNNPLMVRIDQEDYQEINEKLLKKIDAVFLHVDQTESQTKKVFSEYIKWKKTEEQRLKAAEIEELKNRLASLGVEV